jgi:hypothetical protein
MVCRAPCNGWQRVGLTARFDGQALAAFDLPGDVPKQPAWLALRDWCLARPAQRFAVAVPAAAALSAAAPWGQALALQLDGSHALAACSNAAAKWALRLRVKWQDLRTSEPGGAMLSPVRVWDSGRVRDPAALERFQPRRPTFIVVDAGQPAVLLAALDTLQTRSASFTQPVRVLWLLPEPPDMAARGWTVLRPLPQAGEGAMRSTLSRLRERGSFH